MAEVNISINGRIYEIGCDTGQEGRVVDLASYIDQRLQQIARSGAAYNDAHLMVLTALVLADEIFDTREKLAAKDEGPSAPAKARKDEAAAPAAAAAAMSAEDEKAVAQLLEKLVKRIDGIAARVQAA